VSKKISDKMLFPPYSRSEVINRLERRASRSSKVQPVNNFAGRNLIRAGLLDIILKDTHRPGTNISS